MADTHTKEILGGSSMSLAEHLDDLRRRLFFIIAGLFIAFVFCLFFSKFIIGFIERPYVEAMKAIGEDTVLQVIAPTEGFTSYMEIAGVCSIVLSSPWIFYHLWMFISAGLYPKEKRYVYMAVPFSAFLFVAGALLFFFLIGPVTLKFFVLFNKEILGVRSIFTFSKYMSFIAIMMLVFGLSFQTPIAIFFLIKTGLITITTFNKFRRYVIFGIVVISAAVTPGSDLFSLLALSISLYLLFEMGVLIGYLSERKKAKSENNG